MTERYGYKYTAKGEYPPDWHVDLLDRFWEVTDCKHVTATFVPRGIPVASIREVQSRFVNLVHANQTTTYFYAILVEGGRDPREGDLIFSRNATVGAVAQVASWHPKFAMGQDVCLLRRKVDGFAPGFLQALIQSPVIGRQLDELMVGSTFKRVNVQQIRAFRIPMPSAVEQRAIAAALSDVDALLDAIDRVIAKKRAIKQATMQQLLTGRTRLPGFSGEWAVKRLGDHCRFLKTGTQSRAQLDSVSETRYLHYGDVHTYAQSILDVVHEEMPRIDSLTATSLERLADGDLIFVDASEDVIGIGKAVEIRMDSPIPIVAGLHTIAVRFNSDALARGFTAYLQYLPSFRQHLLRLAAGTKVYATSTKHIASATVALPPLPEQRAIAAVLSDMDAELEALQTRRHKTQQVKQGMMQELLTGRTRLV